MENLQSMTVWGEYYVMCLEFLGYSLISAAQCIWKIMQRLKRWWFGLWYPVSEKQNSFFPVEYIVKHKVLIRKISENWGSEESFHSLKDRS